MARASVRIDDREYVVGSLSLRLSMGSGPVCRLRLQNDFPSHDISFQSQAVISRASATVVSADNALGKEFSLLTLGFDEDGSGVGDSLRTTDLVGLLCSQETYDWFAAYPANASNLVHLIYQRAPETEPRTYLKSLYGSRLGSEWYERLAPIFPDWSCIVRSAASDNLTFVRRLTRHLRDRSNDVIGWFFVGATDTPLRLVTTADTPSLDAEWRVQRPVFPVDRLAGQGYPLVLRRQFEIDESGVFDFVKTVATSGLPASVDQIQVSPQSEILLAPGQVYFEGASFICQSIEYHFDLKNPQTFAAQVELSELSNTTDDEALPSLSTASVGKFDSWFEKVDGAAIAMLSSENSDWGILNASGDGVDSELRLGCHILVSSSVRGTEEGIYVRHLEGDEKAFSIHPGRVPFVGGGLQRYNEAMESAEADIVLNGKKVILSSSERDAATDEVEGLRIDGSEITLEGKKTQIMAEGVFEEGKVTVDAKTEVKGEFFVGPYRQK